MSSRAPAAGDGAPSAPFQVGLLGHGTVGSAFAGLLEERAAEIERFNGRRPVISGVLTRSQGSFEEILAGADLLVELIGGIEPAREYLLTAMRAGRDVVSANKQLLSQHGEELFETAREHGVRLRFEAAVAGRSQSFAFSRSRWQQRRSSASTESSTARPTSFSPR